MTPISNRLYNRRVRAILRALIEQGATVYADGNEFGWTIYAPRGKQWAGLGQHVQCVLGDTPSEANAQLLDDAAHNLFRMDPCTELDCEVCTEPEDASGEPLTLAELAEVPE